MIKHMDKRLRLTIGITFIIGSFFGGLIGYDLRSLGENYNHIWVLSIIALYAGLDWVSKSFND